MKRYYLTMDLTGDEKLIAESEDYHFNIGAQIKRSITESGIVGMEIYRISNRLFMVMETTDNSGLEKKSVMDTFNPIIEEWGQLIWKHQQILPLVKPGEKWVLMKNMFQLNGIG